ncbi:MAG: AmmeMemoRadiSam system protein B [Desulfurococcaceae archaeon]
MNQTKYVREPVVAGYFYPDNPVELTRLLDELFTKNPHGPGRKPVVNRERIRGVVGYISPHAGYIYSGPVAAHAYLSLAETGLPETIIIIGTNHTGLGSLVSIYPGGKWITPLGELVVDSELGERISKYSELAELDTDAHLDEHSVEVQLPFIQYVYGNRVKILPIVIGLHTVETAQDLARAIKKSIDETNRDVVIIASSDFNHYEPYEVTKRKDLEAIDYIIKFDTEGFYRVIVEKHITICGPGGIMTLIEYTKLIGGEKKKAELLKYANSGDTSNYRNGVVGYASIKFFIEK